MAQRESIYDIAEGVKFLFGGNDQRSKANRIMQSPEAQAAIRSGDHNALSGILAKDASNPHLVSHVKNVVENMFSGSGLKTAGVNRDVAGENILGAQQGREQTGKTFSQNQEERQAIFDQTGQYPNVSKHIMDQKQGQSGIDVNAQNIASAKENIRLGRSREDAAWNAQQMQNLKDVETQREIREAANILGYGGTGGQAFGLESAIQARKNADEAARRGLALERIQGRQVTEQEAAGRAARARSALDYLGMSDTTGGPPTPLRQNERTKIAEEGFGVQMPTHRNVEPRTGPTPAQLMLDKVKEKQKSTNVTSDTSSGQQTGNLPAYAPQQSNAQFTGWQGRPLEYPGQAPELGNQMLEQLKNVMYTGPVSKEEQARRQQREFDVTGGNANQVMRKINEFVGSDERMRAIVMEQLKSGQMSLDAILQQLMGQPSR